MVSRFIVFEGCEGSGKSSQLSYLAEVLRGRGEVVLETREPGGCVNAEAIRELLLADVGVGEGLLALSQLYMMLAARHEHIELVIKPALLRGEWVLCDRFHYSTYAYQGYGGGLDIGLIDSLARPLADVKPDMVLVLDIEPSLGFDRISKRGVTTSFEAEDLSYHRRVREGFLAMARDSRYGKASIIDGSGSIAEVSGAILSVIEAL